MTVKDQLKHIARLAKKAGVPVEKILPTLERHQKIVRDEYNRYQPQGIPQ